MAINNETLRRMRLADLMAQGDWGPGLMVPQEDMDSAISEKNTLGDLIGQIPGTFGRGQGAFQRAGGELVQINPQPMQQDQQMLDYANPIDYMGAKGYRLKGDSSRVQLNDGRMVDLLPSRAKAEKAQQQAQMLAQQKEESRLLDMETKRAELANKQRPEWQIDIANGVAINKNDPRQVIPLSAGQGGKQVTKPEQWKYDSGSDTWVAPPTEDNPQGRVTVPASRSNALNSMKYVIGQFDPVLQKTPQGGILGVTGTIGRLTNSQDARRFDNLREQLSTELRTVFRIPGEGTLSDKEQAQYGIQLPDVKNDQETNKAILNDVLNRSNIRISGAQNKPPQPAQSPNQLMQEAQDAIARGAPRDAVIQRLQERLRGQ